MASSPGPGGGDWMGGVVRCPDVLFLSAVLATHASGLLARGGSGTPSLAARNLSAVPPAGRAPPLSVCSAPTDLSSGLGVIGLGGGDEGLEAEMLSCPVPPDGESDRVVVPLSNGGM